MELPADRQEVVRFFGEGDSCVVIVIKGDGNLVEAAKHAALSTLKQLKQQVLPEPETGCDGCGK